MKFAQKMKVVIYAAGIALVLPVIGSAASAESYTVVVNAKNNMSAADKEAAIIQVKRIYLKETKNWPGGQAAVPFSGKKTKPVFMALLAGVLSMSQSEYDAYWARLKQTTGDTPPRSVGSKNILLKLIARDAGAIGIISSSEAGSLPNTVKTLFEFEG